ncbi:neuroendocrine protein 7B2 [Neocloeon triangulifer]|uniref:neuroendocrine protein 7B2 n=1 Tax=Neocloeon triangulifer TaxID=2078957 RepID=UPI00286F1F9B|nr:neuroendocrine protein 7B2 [Neocloeon triangulifer]
MASVLFLALFVVVGKVSSYNPHHLKHEPRITDALLREVMDQMAKDLTNSGSYGMQFPVGSRMDPEMELQNQALKDLNNEDQMMGDYGPILGSLDQQPPSLRDQEFMQHSSLWGHQFVTGGAGEGKQRLKPDGTIKNQKQIKTDAVLPAYCNPPNPCPIGYNEGCLSEFENTASFSRNYQASQDCMCDTEHMFDCSMESSVTRALSRDDHRLDQMMHKFKIDNDHKSMVAKKGSPSKDDHNPFLAGDKLPIAAKKGFDFGY